MGIRNYFKGGKLVRMSDGSRCIIRDLGLVKGGKGLRHFECLLRLTVEGVVSKLVQVLRPEPRQAEDRRPSEIVLVRLSRSLEREWEALRTVDRGKPVPVVILVHQCGFKAKSKPVPMELAELRLLGMETVPL